MSAAVKLGTGELLFELLPASKFPCKYFEFFNIVTQIWHMFGSKGLICETDNEPIMSGPKGQLRTISDRHRFVDVHWGSTIDTLVQRTHVTLGRGDTRTEVSNSADHY
jgi:hypothetical protein